MPVSRAITVAALGLACLVFTPAFAKSSKPVLPQYILSARTVAVRIDPSAGESLSDPDANQTAQRDVESALLKWGRFTTVVDSADADLILVLRKGHSKLADVTVTDPQQNSRPIAIPIGAPHGLPPPGTQDGNSPPHPQAEIGRTDDSFLVFEGKREYSDNDIPAWSWVHKDGLHAHDVPVVDEFRKAIEAAEKQAAAQQQGKHP